MVRLWYLLYTLAHVALLIWGATLWRRRRSLGLSIVLLVTLGLIYDNLILAAGSSIGAGPLLHALSIPRFVLHQMLLPWVILASFEIVRRAGHPWAETAWARWGALALSLLAMAFGFMTRVRGLQLEPRWMEDLLRYSGVAVKGPPVATILSVGFVGVMGALLWRRDGWPWLFVVTFLVFTGEALPIGDARLILGSGLEIFFIAAFLATERGLLSKP